MFSSDRFYYPTRDRSERSETYALGVVLFKCLFGFVPFEEKHSSSFSIANYMDWLNDKTPEDCSKIYYFLKARLRLSKEVIDLLELALTYNRTLSIEDMMAHPWLTNGQNVAPF